MEENGFKDKIFSVLGFSGDEDEYDDSELEYEEEEEIEARRAPTTSGKSTYTTAQASPDVLVLEPTNFEEAPGIVNKLKEEKTIVVNLKQTDFDEGRKIFDFLSGAVFALEGSLNRIAESVFILAPRMVSVSTQMPDENQMYQSEILSWEEESE